MISIFERLKTQRGKRTIRAWRQRFVIRILAESSNPADRTRIGLAKHIAGTDNLKWQTVYPGIFNDIEDIMKPRGLIREGGRLPTKRGPKIVQEQGSPYYELTIKGAIVALAIREITEREGLIKQILAGGDTASEEALRTLSAGSPVFVAYMMERYVEAWCLGKIDLMPFDLKKLASTDDQQLRMCHDLLRGFADLDGKQKERMVAFLDSMVRE